MGYGYGYDLGYGYGLGALGGATVAGWVIGIIALWVFIAAIRWKVFQKAGVEGWKSIIPIYGDYVEWSIIWGGKWFWFNILAGVVVGIGFAIPLIGPTLAFAAILFSMVLRVFFCLQYAHAFGKDDGFGIGLMIAAFVFKLIIAFDADIKYQGAQPDPKFFNSMKVESDHARAAMAARRAEANDAPSNMPGNAPYNAPANMNNGMPNNAPAGMANNTVTEIPREMPREMPRPAAPDVVEITVDETAKTEMIDDNSDVSLL